MRRRVWPPLLALLAGCSGIRELRSWFPREAEARIADRIYFVGTRGLAAFLIKTSDGHILINSGIPSRAAWIDSSIERIGSLDSVRILLATQPHVDHVGAHAHVQKRTKAAVYVMAEDAAVMRTGGLKDFQYGQDPSLHFPPVHVDRELKHGDTVRLGDVSLLAVHTPGHSRGSTSWRFHITERGRRYEVLIVDGTSRNPGYRFGFLPSYRGIKRDFCRTFQRLEALRPHIWLAPHTRFFDFHTKRRLAETMKTDAWVDPRGYAEFLASQRLRFEKKAGKCPG